MKKFLTAIVCAAFLCVATTAMATSIYYEATDVTGQGVINYGYTTATINDTPVFSFTGTFGTVSENLADFTAGDYTISVTLDGFWADFNEDGTSDFTLPDTSFTSGPYMIPSLPPLIGTYGQLSWNINPYSGGSISYDFGTTGTYTNAGVNAQLASIDFVYSGAANGVMDANIGWDKLRVELNSPAAPVPEPSTILLLGLGLIGMAGYGHKRFSKKG